MLPGVFEWIAFTLIYLLIPNRAVRWQDAVLAALIAAVLLEISKYRVRLVHHPVPGLPDDLWRAVEYPDIPAVALYRMVHRADRGRGRGGPAGMAGRQDLPDRSGRAVAGPAGRRGPGHPGGTAAGQPSGRRHAAPYPDRPGAGRRRRDRRHAGAVAREPLGRAHQPGRLGDDPRSQLLDPARSAEGAGHRPARNGARAWAPWKRPGRIVAPSCWKRPTSRSATCCASRSRTCCARRTKRPISSISGEGGPGSD